VPRPRRAEVFFPRETASGHPSKESAVAPVRVLTFLRAATLVATAALSVVVCAGSPASATPSPGEVEAQLDAKWNELEPLIEQYNTVHSQLAANQSKADQLQGQLQPLELQVDLAMSKVSALAVGVYKNGPVSGLNAMLGSTSPTQLADQMTLLNMLARNQRQQISNVAQARDKYVGDKRVLDTLIAQQSKQDADLAAKKKQIEGQIADLQKLRQTAYGASAPASGALKPWPCPVEYIGGAAGTAVQKACSLIGKPYHWADAGQNGGYDCSGLTMAAWAAAGRSLAHSSQTQMTQTKRISRAELRPGDLIFFYPDRHHVGIYVGGGVMVHAPHTNDFVREAKLDSYAGNIAGYGRP
jgi:cell wall-associated NlpC family hydrolase